MTSNLQQIRETAVNYIEPIPKVIFCLNYKFTCMSFREIYDILWNSIELYLPPHKPHTGRPVNRPYKVTADAMCDEAKIYKSII